MTIRDNLIAYGGVLKWPKRSVLKTERSLIATRGFNSLHLRHMPWNVMFQGFFLSVGLGYHSHTLAYATTTYHKRFHKSRDYSGLYGINLIMFCTVFFLTTSIMQALRFEKALAPFWETRAFNVSYAIGNVLFFSDSRIMVALLALVASGIF